MGVSLWGGHGWIIQPRSPFRMVHYSEGPVGAGVWASFALLAGRGANNHQG
jgi:hypothetical protein